MQGSAVILPLSSGSMNEPWPPTAIYASRILTPHEEISDSVIIVEGGRIAAIGHRDEIRLPEDAEHSPAGDMIVVPGFVDMHIHGAAATT